MQTKFSYDIKEERTIRESNGTESVKQLQEENEWLRKGIDRTIYQLANEDIFDEQVIHGIHAELVELLKAKDAESTGKSSFMV